VFRRGFVADGELPLQFSGAGRRNGPGFRLRETQYQDPGLGRYRATRGRRLPCPQAALGEQIHRRKQKPSSLIHGLPGDARSKVSGVWLILFAAICTEGSLGRAMLGGQGSRVVIPTSRRIELLRIASAGRARRVLFGVDGNRNQMHRIADALPSRF